MIIDPIRALAGRILAAMRNTASHRGQALVEAAGAMTALMLLVIGIVDFSPIVVKTAQLTQAVRDGTNYARTSPESTSEIRKRVVQAAPTVYGSMTDAQINAMTNSQIAVSCVTGLSGAAKACTAAVPGDSVTVTAIFPFTTLTGLFSALLAAPIDVSRSATSEIF